MFRCYMNVPVSQLMEHQFLASGLPLSANGWLSRMGGHYDWVCRHWFQPLEWLSLRVGGNHFQDILLCDRFWQCRQPRAEMIQNAALAF